MKYQIMIVEDNLQIMKNIEMMLTFNNYDCISGVNGVEALEKLSKLEKLPDLIISDIMMPEMDGYEFFQTVSKNNLWSEIPFIFLTAKATPEDVRLGKMLGVDDYLAKPFKEEDLLASIKGKLVRKEKIREISKNVQEMMSKIAPKFESKKVDFKKENICLVYSTWDEEEGPTIVQYHPENWRMSLSIEDISAQLFQATVAIYGYENYDQSHGMLLEIKNIGNKGYIYFDSIADKDVRGQFRQYMIGVIAPNITYFDALKLKLELTNMSQKIKNQENWTISVYWDKIVKILLRV